MVRTRVIPCLLLKGGGLVKTVGFKEPKYVGDPINAVRIFSEKEVDELILLDIDASRQGREPHYSQIHEIVSEAFMPIAYGGGIKTAAQAKRLIGLGLEKVILNSAVLESSGLVTELAGQIGSSSTVVAIDVVRDAAGAFRVYNAVDGRDTGKDALDHARQVVEAGAGEVFLNDVARDGTGTGYDLGLLRSIAAGVEVPVIVCGGACKLEHFKEAAAAGASAVAAGSMFVYVGKHRAVMINYPSYKTLMELFEGAPSDA